MQTVVGTRCRVLSCALVAAVVAASQLAAGRTAEAAPPRGGGRVVSAARTAPPKPESAAVAKQVDQFILEEGAGSASKRANDEDFLRRVTFDLAGTLPSPREVTLFGLDPDPEKRAKVIDRLLASDEFSRNWARYWRDVIFTRATEMRSQLGQQTFEEWMFEQLKNNTSWDKVATDLLTATGDVSSKGETALMFAHGAEPVEVAAEASRIFLGIQIQCANCHDHPTDKWKREQFHQLAAFFPRTRLQPVMGGTGGPRSFEIASLDNTPGGGRFADQSPEEIRRAAERVFRLADKNNDGKVTRAEAEGVPGGRILDRLFDIGDTDKDKALSAEELKKIPPPPMNMRRGSREYFMPDLENPGSEGTRIDPEFFVGKVSPGKDKSDKERRESLAKYMTSSDNPWFAKALVNRLWGEMLGDSFYMPIDDLGPERQPQHPKALDLLAESFTANDYDVRWLYRTIASTDAYQRSIKAKKPTDEAPAFTSASPSRLRSDQIYSALTSVLGIDDLGGGPRPQPGQGGPMNRFRGPRQTFAQLFGFDPSTPQDEILGSVPQALFLMNSPFLANLIRADGRTTLSQILTKHKDDEDAILELYLRVLAREPSDREMKICREYLAEVKDRREAFEDLMWSLLNSSEFLSKR